MKAESCKAKAEARNLLKWLDDSKTSIVSEIRDLSVNTEDVSEVTWPNLVRFDTSYDHLDMYRPSCSQMIHHESEQRSSESQPIQETRYLIERNRAVHNANANSSCLGVARRFPDRSSTNRDQAGPSTLECVERNVRYKVRDERLRDEDHVNVTQPRQSDVEVVSFHTIHWLDSPSSSSSAEHLDDSYSDRYSRD